ncbi:MAG: hypothetical protein JKY89_03685 [Immundisolibacteraceae bacterium]|nr:hypothetical protein [Immundisolibacteraceae bacterium]
MAYKSETAKKFLVTFEKNIVDKIESIAKLEKRSRNSQILHWIEKDIKEYE